MKLRIEIVALVLTKGIRQEASRLGAIPLQSIQLRDTMNSALQTVWKLATRCIVSGLACIVVTGDGLAGGPRLSESAHHRFETLTKGAKHESAWKDARDRALAKVIDPDAYECGPTDFDAWFGWKLDSIQNLGPFIDIVVNYGALDWPTYYSLVFDQNERDEFIGVDGAETRKLRKRHIDLQGFWNVNTRDVMLQGMHAKVMADDSKMVPLVEFLFGVDTSIAQEVVDYVQSVIAADPGLGFRNPLFTLNAFAFSGRDEPLDSPFRTIPDKIIMGDGILEMLSDLGLDANAPVYVLAHEFGHQVQYRLGVFDVAVAEEDLPEATRRTELMADAFGAYFCAHVEGAAFRAWKIRQVYSAAYLVGDCAFDSPGHHGTPNQRDRAAQWGADLASSAAKRRKILPAATVLQLFDANLPALVAPDAP